MKRLSPTGLLELGAGLSGRERQVVRDVARLGLMTQAQLARLFDSDQTLSGARATRRLLQRLSDAGVLTRLDRRIGGVRAGSAGYVYYLGPAGQRLLAYWNGHGLTRGRVRPEPGSRYVSHRLAVSEIYVQACEAERQGHLDLLAFEAEPACWRTFGDRLGGQRTLKPDAFTRIGLGAYEESHFIEVDLGSESRGVVAAKIGAYFHYFNTGVEQQAHGVFPRVLILTTTEERRAALIDACARRPPETWQIFTITTLDQAANVLTGQTSGDTTAQEHV